MPPPVVLTDYSQVNFLGPRYKSVTFEVKTSPVSSKSARKNQSVGAQSNDLGRLGLQTSHWGTQIAFWGPLMRTTVPRNPAGSSTHQGSRKSRCGAKGDVMGGDGGGDASAERCVPSPGATNRRGYWRWATARRLRGTGQTDRVGQSTRTRPCKPVPGRKTQVLQVCP